MIKSVGSIIEELEKDGHVMYLKYMNAVTDRSAEGFWLVLL